MSTVSDIAKYRELGSIAASLKLEALKRRAMNPQTDEERWPMILAYHNAARYELFRLALVSDPSPATEARARIEATALFLESGDPVSAKNQRLLLSAIEGSLSGVEKAFLAKIERDFKKYKRRSSELYRSRPISNRDSLNGIKSKDIKRILQDFPGDSKFWFVLHLVAIRERNKQDARVAIRRARDLDPDDEYAAAASIMFPAMFLPVKDLDKELAHMYGEWYPWEDFSGYINITYVMAVMAIHQGKMKRSKLRGLYDIALRAKYLGVDLAFADVDGMLAFIAKALAQGGASVAAETKSAGTQPEDVGSPVPEQPDQPDPPFVYPHMIVINEYLRRIHGGVAPGARRTGHLRNVRQPRGS